MIDVVSMDELAGVNGGFSFGFSVITTTVGILGVPTVVPNDPSLGGQQSANDYQIGSPWEPGSGNRIKCEVHP